MPFVGSCPTYGGFFTGSLSCRREQKKSLYGAVHFQFPSIGSNALGIYLANLRTRRSTLHCFCQSVIWPMDRLGHKELDRTNLQLPYRRRPARWRHASSLPFSSTGSFFGEKHPRQRQLLWCRRTNSNPPCTIHRTVGSSNHLSWCDRHRVPQPNSNNR